METERALASPYSCPSCGGPMEAGYILGKQSRLRWATSPQGYTVFKGTPLSSLPRNFWFSRAGWTQAPSIRAARCERCGIGVFEYEANPHPLRSGTRAAVFAGLGFICLLASAFMITGSLFVNLTEGGGELVFLSFLGLFLLFVLAAVGLFVRFFVETI